MLNPIRASVVKRLKDWAWSSYPAVVDRVETPQRTTHRDHSLADSLQVAITFLKRFYKRFTLSCMQPSWHLPMTHQKMTIAY